MDFLVIGAQKCATSWLYCCLREHLQLHLPPVKEEKVYLGGALYHRYGIEWYREQMGNSDNAQAVGDVSVDYLLDRRSPPVIVKYAPDAKFIAVLRDPVERAVSAYFWNLRRGNVLELDVDRGLSRAIDEWRRHGPDQTYNPDAHYYNIIARGLYARQLDRYIDRFGSQSVYLLYYDDIKANPKDAVQRVFRILDVDPTVEPPSLSRRPKQNSYFRPLLRLEQSLPNNAVFGKVSDLANQALCTLGLGREKPTLSAHVEAELRSLFAPHDDRLGGLSRKLPRSNVLTSGSPLPPWVGVRAQSKPS